MTNKDRVPSGTCIIIPFPVKGRGSNLLFGLNAISSFLGTTPDRTRSLIRSEHLPTFRIGGRLCARRSSLFAYIAERELAGRPIGQRPRTGEAQ